MGWLKGGLLAKLLVGVLAAIVGVGGVAAGARYSAQKTRTPNSVTVVGTILSVNPARKTFVILTRKQVLLLVTYTDATSIHHLGKTVTPAILAAHEVVTVQGTRAGQHGVEATVIRVLRLPPRKSSP